MTIHVRPAELADHPLFVRLFPELEVDDPILDLAKFAHQLLPTTLVAEAASPGGERRPVGYLYFQIMKEMAYVRHIVTAPEARRTGVGRALLGAVLDRARAAGCSGWCLNVKPDNTVAITLYESLGLRRAHTSRALNMAWNAIESAPLAELPVIARDVAPADDARVETAMRLVDGQLANARTVSGRVLKMLEDDGRVVGATIFHPDFPGASPFRVARPELALVLLRALRPHAMPGDATLSLMTEDQPEVADALIAAGATVKLDAVHMEGPLPSQP